MWKEIECPLCYGDPEADCRLCHGRGRVSSRYVLLYDQGCPLCGGSGWMMVLGSGAPDDPDHEDHCPLCAVAVAA